MKKQDKVLKFGLVIFVVVLLAAALKIWVGNRIRNEFTDDYRQAIFENSYVAHALGGINGNTYTNSKEAIENALTKGFHFFEADVMMTSDDKLVLFHRWGEWEYENLLNGREFDSENAALTYEEFMNEKIARKYTAMDFGDLVDYMKENNEMYVMLDFGKQGRKKMGKIYDEILKTTQDRSVLDRLIVGGYDTAMVEAAQMSYDFKLYNLYWAAKDNRKDTRIDTKEEFLKYCKENRIVSLSTSVSTYEEEKKTIEWFKKNGMIVYLYTEDDEKKAEEYLNIVDLVGTNDIGLK